MRQYYTHERYVAKNESRTHKSLVIQVPQLSSDKGPGQQSIIFKYWTLISLITKLNYIHSLIYNFKNVVSHPYFTFLYFVCIFSIFMMILAEIYVEVLLWRYVKKAKITERNNCPLVKAVAYLEQKKMSRV